MVVANVLTQDTFRVHVVEDGDLRIAAGIAGFKDSDIPEGTTPDNATARTDVFNWAPEVSVGFGTLKIAGGWVLNDRVLSDSSRWNRLRVFVGVDLLKLITGKNVEAL